MEPRRHSVGLLGRDVLTSYTPDSKTPPGRSLPDTRFGFLSGGSMAVFVGLVGFRMFYASLPGMFTLWLSILTAAGRMIAGYGMGRREAASDEDELGTDELARIVFARLVEEEGDPSGDDE